MGLPAAPYAAPSGGYANISQVRARIDDVVAAYPSAFGGVMLWVRAPRWRVEGAARARAASAPACVASPACARVPSEHRAPQRYAKHRRRQDAGVADTEKVDGTTSFAAAVKAYLNTKAVACPPPAQAETVFTRIAVTRTAKCGRGFTRMALKPQAGSAKVVSLCFKTATLAAGAKTPRRFVADAVAVIGTRAGRRALPLSRMACPSGFSRLNKNLNDGAGPVDGVITSIVLCVRMVTPASGVAPLLGMATASSAAGCDVAAGLRPVTFGGARSGELAGTAANLAEGTPGAPVFLCVRHRA